MPRSQTPVDQPALASIGPADTAFRTLNYVGPTMASLSRLNHAACLLAVYASPVRLPSILDFQGDIDHLLPIKPGFSWRPQGLTPTLLKFSSSSLIQDF
jgi:hypothetical protein